MLLVVTLFLSFSGYLLPVGPAGVLGGDHRHIDGRSRAAEDRWRNRQPAGPWRARHQRQRLACASICCMSFSCRLVLILFFFVHYYKVVHFGISLPANEEEVGQDTANKVPADRRVYYLAGRVDRRDECSCLASRH